MAQHGYGPYTNGCRCAVCRAAKAAYVRAKRASARELRVHAAASGERYVAEGITHGYAGYQDYSCRCGVCTAARSSKWHVRRKQEKMSA